MLIFILLLLLVSPVHAGGPNNRVIGSMGSVSAQGLGKSPTTDRGGSYIQKSLEHNANRPVKPDCGPVFSEYNRTFNKYEEYNKDVIRHEIEGDRLRKQYNDPRGFGYNE